MSNHLDFELIKSSIFTSFKPRVGAYKPKFVQEPEQTIQNKD